MKRLLLLSLYLVMTVCMVYAQELKVKSMEVSPTDLSASTHPRQDKNGVPCGLVKVQLAAVGAKYEGNVLGDTEYKTGEYWVYMSQGSYMLRIKHPNFVPLNVNFRDYGIRSVEPKTTYVLTLQIPQGNQEIDDGMRYLVLNVEPKNSTVYIDNNIQEVQDGTVSIRLSKGVHAYRVEAPGYKPEIGNIDVEDIKTVKPVVLKSLYATLQVTCATEQVKIYINEELKGNAPWKGTLRPGDYLVEARREGHRSQKLNVHLSASETQDLSIPALIPITSSMDVNYKPVGAEVWLDGKQLGTSPDIFRGILVGKHDLEIRKGGYETTRQTVVIEERKTTNVSGSLQSARGTVMAAAATASDNGDLTAPSATMSKFFPIYGITIGSATHEDVAAKGYAITEREGCYHVMQEGAGTFSDDNSDNVFESFSVYHFHRMPELWESGIGLKWSLSYNQITRLFQNLGYKISVVNAPTTENYQGRKTLSAKFKATSPDGELEFRFTFDYGNEAKEGYTIDSSNSLFSIDVTYIGRIAPNLRKNINSGSSYTLEHLISHPLIYLDENDISLKYKDAYKKLEKTHDQQSWKLENYKGRYIYLRSKGSNNKFFEGERNIQVMHCYWSNPSAPMTELEMSIVDSHLYSSFEEAKVYVEGVVERLKAMGYDMKADNEEYTGSNGIHTIKLRLPKQFFNQLHITVMYNKH